MKNPWESNIENLSEYSSLSDMIVGIYTTDEFIKAADAGEYFISRTYNVNKIYDRFEEEIHERCPVGDILHDDAEYMDYGVEFYDSLKGSQVDRAIIDAVAEFKKKYQEVIVRHPGKKLSDLISIYPDHFKEENTKDLAKHKSLRAFVKVHFTGRDYIGAVGDEGDNISLGATEDRLFELFPDEIRELAGNDKLTAKEVTESWRIVWGAVNTLVQRLYKENKEALLDNPDKTIVALERMKQSGRDNS